MFLRKLLFRYSTPNLTIAFHFWQYWKCLKNHICPGLSFCPCTELFQNVNILLSCWLAQWSTQELPSWCSQCFQTSHKIQAFFPLKQSWAVLASVPCHCIGDRVPQEMAVISGREELTDTLQEKTSGIYLLGVDLWHLAFLQKAASFWKPCAYLGPSCLKQDFGYHSQGQELMSWVLNSSIAWCLSPSLQLVQKCKN